MANKPTAQPVPRCLGEVATATFLWLTSSHLHPRIWWTILGRNQVIMVRSSAQIHHASRCWKPAFKSLNGRFKRGLSDISDTSKSFETVILVCFPITSKVLLLMRMYLGYVSTIRLWILPLQVLWPMASEQAAAQLQISPCEETMHLLDGCSRIYIVGRDFHDTLKGGCMGNNLEFFSEVLGLFLVFCLFYNNIIHLHAGRDVLRVHNVGNNRWEVYFWERHGVSNRTPCIAIM